MVLSTHQLIEPVEHTQWNYGTYDMELWTMNHGAVNLRIIITSGKLLRILGIQ